MAYLWGLRLHLSGTGERTIWVFISIVPQYLGLLLDNTYGLFPSRAMWFLRLVGGLCDGDSFVG